MPTARRLTARWQYVIALIDEHALGELFIQNDTGARRPVTELHSVFGLPARTQPPLRAT